MSGIPQTRKLWITPLSPVHMGTDEDYTPTSYVIEGDALYEFDQQALENLPDGERKRLNGLLDGKARPEMLKAVQAFFHRNRERLIPAAVNVVKVSAEMARLYENRVGRAANVEADGRQVLNALEIERACYNPTDRRLMLPGSGLKGAMRTALLDALNQGKPRNSISYFDKKEKRQKTRKENNRELQERLFEGAFARDPMRLVHIGDCAWHGPESLNSAEVLFAVNRKKHPVVDENGNLRASQAENLYQLLECAAPFRLRAFQGTLNISDFGDTRNISNRLPRFRFSFGEIAKACNRFYRPIFDRELALLRKRGFLDSAWREITETLLGDASIRRRLESNDAFLLRVGRHSGAESVTLNGIRSIRIKDRKVDENLADAIREAKKDRTLRDETLLLYNDEKVSFPVKLRDLNVTRSGEIYYFLPEPKTIWLATDDKADRRYLKPFGWLLVEMTSVDEVPPPWPEAEAIMETYNEAMTQWLANVRERQSILAAKARANREERAARAAQEAREAEEKARREKEKQERLARLSPLEREMEEIIAANRNNNPGAALFNRLTAGEWAESDQRIVAEKIKTLWTLEGKWIPDFSGTNKQKVKQRERCRKVLEYLPA